MINFLLIDSAIQVFYTVQKFIKSNIQLLTYGPDLA